MRPLGTRTHREHPLEHLEQRRADDDEGKEREQDWAERRALAAALRESEQCPKDLNVTSPRVRRARALTSEDGSDTLPRLVTLLSYF